MLTRREVLIGAGIGGAALLAARAEDVFASASQPTTAVNFTVPAGACDCHTHIFGDPQQFPWAPGRVYTPSRHPSPKCDLCTEHCIPIAWSSSIPRSTGPTIRAPSTPSGSSDPRARGIAVIGEKTSEAILDEMHQGGIRGIRVNLETAGQTDPEIARQKLKAAVDRIKQRRHWHVELYARLSVIEAVKDQVMASPVPISFDHFGGAQAALGAGQPGFDVLLGLVSSGKAYVKVSAPYRSSKLTPSYSDVAPLAKALIAANPQRIIWGTDWPHPAQIPGRKPEEITPLYQIDDGRDLNLVAMWAPEPAERKQILVDNPAKLYGF